MDRDKEKITLTHFCNDLVEQLYVSPSSLSLLERLDTRSQQLADLADALDGYSGEIEPSNLLIITMAIRSISLEIAFISDCLKNEDG